MVAPCRYKHRRYKQRRFKQLSDPGRPGPTCSRRHTFLPCLQLNVVLELCTDEADASSRSCDETQSTIHQSTEAQTGTRIMSIRTLVLAALFAMGSATGALAGDGHSQSHDHDHGKSKKSVQLDAHEHGVGKLNIAIDGKTVAMELEIPAADIVGFEHAAKTKKQKAALAKAKKTLAAPAKLFQISSAAGCKVKSAKVETEGAIAKIGQSHGHSHSHDHDHGKKKGKAAAEETHSEFHATYAMSCSNPGGLKAITFVFFKSFPNSKELEVALVGSRGVKSFEATP